MMSWILQMKQMVDIYIKLAEVETKKEVCPFPCMDVNPHYCHISCLCSQFIFVTFTRIAKCQ